MNHETLFKLVMQALQNPQDYSIARQLGLYMWMASQHNPNLKTHESIRYSDEFHHDYSRSIPFSKHDGNIIRYILADTEQLSKDYPYGDGIIPHNGYKNLLIMTSPSTWGIFEIDIDESAIIQALFNQQYGQVEHASELSKDKELQGLIADIYLEMKKRIDSMNVPLQWRNGLSLPIPKSPANYIKQMKHALQNNIMIGRSKAYQFEARQLGDVARRLRVLDMYQDTEGSIRGAYENKHQKLRWETLSLDERAAYENRILGAGQFHLDELGDMMIMMIARDRFKDGAGYQFILGTANDTRLITLNADGQINAAIYGDISNVFEGLHYGEKELNAAIEAWEDGLRVASWMNLLFEIIDEQFNCLNSIVVIEFFRGLLA